MSDKTVTLKVGETTVARLKRERWLVLDNLNSIRAMSTNMGEARSFAEGHAHSSNLRVVHASELNIEVII